MPIPLLAFCSRLTPTHLHSRAPGRYLAERVEQFKEANPRARVDEVLDVDAGGIFRASPWLKDWAIGKNTGDPNRINTHHRTRLPVAVTG